MSRCGLDLTIDLTVVILTLISCQGYILKTVRCRKLILGSDLVGHWFGNIGVQRSSVTLM